ncbi:MAG TPA: SRPBCC family protein [Bacteroidia bacterium]|nr:SRPBCC family protein [Bacteroidia bacterium]
MTRIESDIVEINKSAAEIFSFLSDFNNFQKLMPPQVTNWTSTENECSFTINGMATIGMKIIEKNPNTQIKISANGKNPFAFTLEVLLTTISESKCTEQLVFDADLNPMLKMMVVKPLGNFFNLLVNKLKEINL